MDIAKYWDEIHKQYISRYDGWLEKYEDFFSTDSIILELGCGRAYCSSHLLKKGYKNIVACDISPEVISMVNRENPSLATKIFDLSTGLPFESNSIDVIIADLSLHYFNAKKTKEIFSEMMRVLNPGGIILARVNSTDDINHKSPSDIELEPNFYYNGSIYKRYFSYNTLLPLFKDFEIINIFNSEMDRYDKLKKVWEFCIRKPNNKKIGNVK